MTAPIIPDLSRLKRRLAAVLAATAVLLTAVSWAYYAHRRASLRSDAERLLLSTGQIKLDQLVNWRKERLSDAQLLAESPVFSAYARRLASGRDGREAAALARERLQSFIKHKRYPFVAVADGNGRVLASAGEKPGAMCPQFRRLVGLALDARRPQMGDFYLPGGEDSPHIDIVTPIGGGSRLLLLLRVNPADYLYPLLQSWSAKRETGEILLVTRDGEDVLFLNDLRHVRDAAMRLRRPVNDPDLPAARGLRGDRGVAIGTDYRGVKVLAAVAPVEGTNWALVTKMDWVEVMEGSAAVAVMLALLTLALLALAGAGTYALFRGQAERAGEMLAKLTDQVPGVVYQYRLYPDGRSCFPYSSSGMRQIYEVTSEEVREDATPVFGRLHPDDLEATSEAIFESARKLSVFHWEFRVVLPRQGLRWRLCDARPERMPDGGTLWYGIITDVTDRKLAEEALRAGSRELNEAQRLARVGNWTLDLASNKLSWSDEIYRIFEIDREKFGASYEAFLDAIHPGDREMVNKAYTESLKNRTPYDIEHRLLMKDGRVKYVNECCETFYDAGGRPLRSAGTVQDITERRKAEEALRESERAVRRKLDAILSPDMDVSRLELSDILDGEKIQRLMDRFYALTKIGVGIIDMKGKVLVGTGWQEVCAKFHRVNPESCRLCVESDLELSRGVPAGGTKLYQCKNHMWDMVTPIMLGDVHVGNVFLGQFLFEGEEPDLETFKAQARRYGFDEEKYLAALKAVPRWSRATVDAAMAFYAAFAEVFGQLSFSNVKLANTLEARNRAQAELERTAKALREKNQEMENFLYITTHDLRSPLVNIQGFSQNMENYLNELRAAVAGLAAPREEKAAIEKLAGEKLPAALEYVLSGSRKMDVLITALLKVSRAGRVEMLPVRVNAAEVLQKVGEAMRFQLEQSGAELRIGELPACRADPGALGQVFSNLLDNAVRYRAEGRAPVIEVSGERTGDKAVYRVSDNGPGLPAGDLGRIWNVFYSHERAGARKGEGIGLPMIKRLVEKNGGAIKAEAAPGRGLVFTIELPAGEGE